MSGWVGWVVVVQKHTNGGANVDTKLVPISKETHDRLPFQAIKCSLKFLKPKEIKFEQNGIEKRWEMFQFSNCVFGISFTG